MGLGQYDSIVEYCDPHTASSVFLILVGPSSTPFYPYTTRLDQHLLFLMKII